MRNFKRLECWKLGMEIIPIIYNLIKKLPGEERYGMSSQMSRSALSMPSNIAEGCSRSSSKEVARFFEISIGSAFELETDLLAGQLIGYFNEDDLNKVVPKIIEFQRKTNSYRLRILED